jgi:hypothetical protein
MGICKMGKAERGRQRAGSRAEVPVPDTVLTLLCRLPS